MGCKALGFAFPLKTWYDEQVFSNIRTRDRMNQQPITAILFDLDGTLLPMEQDAFVRTYFAALAKKVAQHFKKAGIRMLSSVFFCG